MSQAAFTVSVPIPLALFGEEYQDYNFHHAVVTLALPLYCQVRVQPLEIHDTGATAGKTTRNLGLIHRVDDSDSEEEQVWTLNLDDLSFQTEAVDEQDVIPRLTRAILSQQQQESNGGAKRLLGSISTVDFVVSLPLVDVNSLTATGAKAALAVALTLAVSRLSNVSQAASLATNLTALAKRAYQAATIGNISVGPADCLVAALGGGLMRVGATVGNPWLGQTIPTHPVRVGCWVLAASDNTKTSHTSTWTRQFQNYQQTRADLLVKLGGSWNGTPSKALSADEQAFLSATLTILDVEVKAAQMLRFGGRASRLGPLLLQHDEVIREIFRPDNDTILSSLHSTAMNNGACGCKTIWNDGGLVAWVENPEMAVAVKTALKLQAGVKRAWIIEEPANQGATLTIDTAGE